MKSTFIICLIIIVFFAGWFVRPVKPIEHEVNTDAELISDAMHEWAESMDELTQALYEFKDFLEGGIEVKLK